LEVLYRQKTLNNIKVVVYTAIFGDSDDLMTPPTYRNVDYICFTDNKKMKSNVWKIIVPDHLPHYSNSRQISKKFKIFPHKYFKEYEYSLWVDGTYIPIIDPRYLVQKFLENSDIALFRHLSRDCIYKEGERCIQRELDNPKTIRNQLNKYKKEKYPLHNGLMYNGIILRKHNTPIIRKIMEEWWREIENFSIRDQISLNYIFYKNSVNYGIIPGNNYKNPFFRFKSHFNNKL